jgi:hypothetical protein
MYFFVKGRTNVLVFLWMHMLEFKSINRWLIIHTIEIFFTNVIHQVFPIDVMILLILIQMAFILIAKTYKYIHTRRS